jgi:tripartite-type tricarboxylate transporter receptor subunit TctC
MSTPARGRIRLLMLFLPGVLAVRNGFVKAGTQQEALQRLNASFNRVLNDPELRSRPALRGVEFTGGSLEQMNAFLRAESERWARVARVTGMRG